MPDPVVRAVNLRKRFDSRAVLADVSVEAFPGDVVGLLGMNGAGKTTLLEVLLGFSPPTGGTSALFGHDSMRLPEPVKGRIGFVPQRDELIDMVTVGQQLALAASLHPRWNSALVERLARDWDLPPGDRIWTLSVGQRQRLSILLALGHEPDLLVFDEPVASLDPMGRRDFLQHLWDLSAEGGRTVLFSSHIMSDLERAATTVWILKDGRMTWQGPLDRLKESVVRLHIHSREPFVATPDVPHVLTSRVEGRHAVLAVAQWAPGVEGVLATRLRADVEVEALGLEDIFLEMHR
jgi:ABC-2 type transport system ATP-binding protein